MVANGIGEESTIDFQSNWLTVDGSLLRADVLRSSRSDRLSVSAEELGRVLLPGRRAILTTIEDFYQTQIFAHPDSTIVRPSLWTAQLGTTTQTDGKQSKVFTNEGYNNGGIIQTVEEINPSFHEHWNAVKQAGFLPEVRRVSKGQQGGAWLLLRKPSLPDVLKHWLQYDSTNLQTAIETLKDDDSEAQLRTIRTFRVMGEIAVDEVSNPERSRHQIGLMLAMAALKSAVGDTTGYNQEIDDAFDYADNDTSIDQASIRALENSTFELNT